MLRLHNHGLILSCILLVLFLTACAPSETAIQTAIAQTAEAAPTLEPTAPPAPTATRLPEPTSTATATPLPAAFLTQLNQFMQDGSRVNGATSQGVTYSEYIRRVSDARASYDLLQSSWPELIDTSTQQELDNAFLAWVHAAEIWELKLDDYDNPVEPDVNGYMTYVGKWGDRLLLDTHPDDFIVPEYRGKKFLPFDENIGLLFGIAADHFDEGLQLLQPYLR